MDGEANGKITGRFSDLLRALVEAGVEFVLIGGLAVGLHGYVRTSDGVGIVPDENSSNRDRLQLLLAELDAEAGRPLDLMPYVEDTEGPLPYDELRAEAEEVTLPEIGRPIYVASVEHLIGMKERAGRDLDQIDVSALRRAHGLEADE